MQLQIRSTERRKWITIRMETTYFGRKQHTNLFVSSHLTKIHIIEEIWVLHHRECALLLLFIQLLPWPALWDRATREGWGMSLTMNTSIPQTKQWSNNPTVICQTARFMYFLNVYQKQTDQKEAAYHPVLHPLYLLALAGCPRTTRPENSLNFPGNATREFTWLTYWAKHLSTGNSH